MRKSLKIIKTRMYSSERGSFFAQRLLQCERAVRGR